MTTNFTALSRCLLAAVTLLVASALIATAQSPYDPVAQVNDGVVTRWELDQRTSMLAALGAPPEIQAEALERLIEERLQLQAADQLDVTVSEQEISEGIAEFAQRGGVTAEQFGQIVARRGVEPETVRDFVRAGIAWRKAVQARFGQGGRIDPDVIGRERETVRPDAGLRVLLSEIILPASDPRALAEARARAAELSEITSFERFSAAAREVSAAPTSDVGGRVDWIALEDLPPQVASAVTSLRPGQVTQPIPIPNGIAVFQLRAIEETESEPGEITVDYAQFLIPGGRTEQALQEAARIEARTDTCDDLYGVAQGLPADRLIREERPLAQVPADVAAELSRLDRNEVSTALTRGGALIYLMLCERRAGGELSFDEAAIVSRIRSQRLGGQAAAWLAELRAESFIERGG